VLIFPSPRVAAPVVVRTEAKEAVLKWYPGEFGAYKYLLQQRFVESLDAIGADGRTKPVAASEEEWTVVYEGQVRT
jgi:hypothetical protein